MHKAHRLQVCRVHLCACIEGAWQRWSVQRSQDPVPSAAGEIRLAKYPEAVALLMRFAAACDKIGLRPCKAYLSAVITWLFAQDGAQALATLQVLSLKSSCGMLWAQLLPFAGILTILSVLAA